MAYINTLSIKPQTIAAFVHFEYEKSKMDCLEYFKKHYLFSASSFHSCMHSVCCCCIEEIKPEFVYDTKPLKIRNSTVPDPEEINWESFEIDGLSRCFRVCFAILVIIVFLLISCAALGICSIYI